MAFPKYIHGLHAGSVNDGVGSTGIAHMADEPGWVVFTEAIGHDRHDLSGGNYSLYLELGLGVIVRLNNGYHPGGTLPYETHYGDFAYRVASYIASTPRNDEIVWAIGNEMQTEMEQPGGKGGEPITTQRYIKCFDLCYREAYKVAPRADVCIGAVAPWYVPVGSSWSSWSSWVDYLEKILAGVQAYDGVLLHTYTHGHDPSLIHSTAKMTFPFNEYYYEFQAFQDFMQVIPPRTLVLITETNPGADLTHKYWDDVNNAWYQIALSAIDAWNMDHPTRVISALVAYRYPEFDTWSMEDKPRVMEDFRAGVAMGYTWEEDDVATVVFQSSINEYYEYDGVFQLTCPAEAYPLHEHDGSVLPQPEYAERHNPEIHTSPNAAGFFTRFAAMEAALVWPIKVKPGDQVRASIFSMTQTDGGRPDTRLGIATEFPGQGAIEVYAVDGHWGGVLESKVQHWGDWGSFSEGEWGQLWSRLVTATGSTIWVIANGRNDVARDAHIHFDDILVEVVNGGTPPGPSNLGDRIRACADELVVIAGEVDLLEAGDCDPAAVALVEQAKGDLEQALGLMEVPE